MIIRAGDCSAGGGDDGVILISANYPVHVIFPQGSSSDSSFGLAPHLPANVIFI
jgi:hypothetical protein